MDRETRIELVVSIGAVLFMIGVMAGIGMMYGDQQGLLGENGGFVLAGALLFFVLFLTGIGYALAYFVKDPEDADTNADADNGNAA